MGTGIMYLLASSFCFVPIYHIFPDFCPVQLLIPRASFPMLFGIRLKTGPEERPFRQKELSTDENRRLKPELITNEMVLSSKYIREIIEI